jgi:hypothetical protein
MNATKSGIGTRMTALAILLALGVSAEAARAAVIDREYRSAALGSHPCTTIAILPAVSVNEDAGAEGLVERSWTEFCGDPGIRWMPADQVRAAVAGAPDGPASLATLAEAQIWRNGEVDSEVAGRLAQLLDVDAVLSVRIDRWEIVDGGRAMVEVTAVLSGADGARLWSISGTAGCGMPRSSVKRNFNADLSSIWNRGMEPREFRSEKLGCALYTLLSGWGGSLPAAPAYAGEGGPARSGTSAIDG